MATERFRVDYQAFDSADEWRAALPGEIAVAGGERPIDRLLAELKAGGTDCRLIKTSRGGSGESYLLNRNTPTGNSQAAVQLIPVP